MAFMNFILRVIWTSCLTSCATTRNTTAYFFGALCMNRHSDRQTDRRSGRGLSCVVVWKYVVGFVCQQLNTQRHQRAYQTQQGAFLVPLPPFPSSPPPSWTKNPQPAHAQRSLHANTSDYCRLLAAWDDKNDHIAGAQLRRLSFQCRIFSFFTFLARFVVTAMLRYIQIFYSPQNR